MFRKFRGIVTGAVNSIGSMKLRGAPRAVIYILCGQLTFLITLYIFGLLVGFYEAGKLDFTATNSLINTLVSGTFIGAILIIGKGLTDKDNDNIPDVFEDDKGGERHDLRQT